MPLPAKAPASETLLLNCGQSHIKLIFPIATVLYVFMACFPAFPAFSAFLRGSGFLIGLNLFSLTGKLRIFSGPDITLRHFPIICSNAASIFPAVKIRVLFSYTFRCFLMVKKLTKNPIPTPRASAVAAIYGNMASTGRN